MPTESRLSPTVDSGRGEPPDGAEGPSPRMGKERSDNHGWNVVRRSTGSRVAWIPSSTFGAPPGRAMSPGMSGRTGGECGGMSPAGRRATDVGGRPNRRLTARSYWLVPAVLVGTALLLFAVVEAAHVPLLVDP